MPADVKQTFDPHALIDLADPTMVRQATQQLGCSEEELAEAVGKVGAQPVAVALYLGRPDVLEPAHA